MSKLPNFNSLPSCLSHQEVSLVVSNIMEVAESGDGHKPEDIESCLNEAIFALLYEPNEEIDVDVSKRVLSWISQNWDTGENNFLDGVCTILVNIHPSGVSEFLANKNKTEKRDKAKEYISEALSELIERSNYKRLHRTNFRCHLLCKNTHKSRHQKIAR